MGVFTKIKNRLNRLINGQSIQDAIYGIKGDIATIEISLPPGHKLPFNQLSYKLYDKKIIQITKYIYDKMRGTCIDIGANIGDTAVAIRASSNMPIICVEGDAEFYQYLDKNTVGLSDIKIVKSFIGGEQKDIKGHYVKEAGTGKFIKNDSDVTSTSFITISNLLSDLNINASDVSLIKSDTDGFDFDIILGSLNFVTAQKTSLFFEYEVNSHESHVKSLEVIDALSKNGYKFIVYDNYGNFYSSVTSDFINRFVEINAYIKSGNSNGGGICYVDVFATTNNILFEGIYKYELDTF